MDLQIDQKAYSANKGSDLAETEVGEAVRKGLSDRRPGDFSSSSFSLQHCLYTRRCIGLAMIDPDGGTY